MSQKHFPEDPLMGKTVTFDDREWEVVDVWIDIAADDDAPRNLDIAPLDDLDDRYSMSVADFIARWPAYDIKTITLRISAETVAFFKAKGEDWMAEMAKSLDKAAHR